MNVTDMMWVWVGGGLGSVLRWQVGAVVSRFYKGNIPLGTFIINVSGAFVIGFLSIFFTVDWQDRYGGLLQSAILTGVIGGYTTFSTMQLEAAKLVNVSQKIGAVAYLIVSVLCGLAAAGFGAWLAMP